MKPIRVLVLAKGLGLGGAERLIVEGIRASRDPRFEYSVAYVLPDKDQLVADLTSIGIGVACIGGDRGSLVYAMGRLRRISKQHDIVHAHLPTTGVIARISSSVPVVYTEHNLADSYRFLTRALNRLTYGRNRQVAAVTERVAASLASYPGVTPHVIPNGVSTTVDRTRAEELRSEFLVPPWERLVVHVGNVRPGKGHGTLVEAAAILGQTHPNVLVLSAGVERHSGTTASLTRQAAAIGASNLRFLGRRDDARALIAAADLLVNPSDVEGLPVVILEAMAACTPVVASRVGGVPGVVIDGQTGWLVEPGDPTSLAIALATALDNTAESARRAANAKLLVDQSHSIEEMTAKYEALYESAIHHRIAV